MSNIAIISVITMLFALFFLLIIIIGVRAFNKTKEGGAKTFRILFQEINFYRLIITLFIIYSVSILTVLDKINSTTISIFSSIAAFILGGITNTYPNGNSNKNE